VVCTEEQDSPNISSGTQAIGTQLIKPDSQATEQSSFSHLEKSAAFTLNLLKSDSWFGGQLSAFEQSRSKHIWVNGSQEVSTIKS